MSDLICRNTMMRCNTPGMCSPHGGCRETEPVSSVWLEQLRSEFRAAVRERDALKAECEGLRKDASLHAQLQRAAEVLPGAWSIEVVVEHHAGWIDVFDDGGNKVVFDGEGHLGEQVSEAIDLVMTLSKESEQ